MTAIGTVGNMPIPIIANGSGTAQAGAAGSLTLNTLASAIADAYKYMQVHILSGTGAGQERNVVSSRKNLMRASSDLSNHTYWRWRAGATILAVTPGVLDPWGGVTAQQVTVGAIFVDDIYQLANGFLDHVQYQFGVWIQRVTSSGNLMIVNPQGGYGGGWQVNLALLPSDWVYLTDAHPAVSYTTHLQGVGVSAGVHFYALAGATLQFNLAGCEAESNVPVVGGYIKNITTQGVGVAVDVPWTTQPDATSQYEIYIAGKTPVGVLSPPAFIVGALTQPTFITGTVGP